MNLIETLTRLGGFWKYDGGKYLAKLTSGNVSDVFCNTGVLTCRPNELEHWIGDLVYAAPLSDNEGSWVHDVPDLYVCGPAMGGITLAYEVARQLGGTAIFTEPKYGLSSDIPAFDELSDFAGEVCDFYEKMRQISVKTGQQLKRFEIPEGATVLFVEDVITTGKSSTEMVQAVVEEMVKEPNVTKRPTILPHILCLVNRSGHTHVGTGSVSPLQPNGLEIISLADVQARTWDTVENAEADLMVKCDESNNPPESVARNELRAEIHPFLKLEAVRPKDHWDLLTKGA